ncbi:ATP-binding cassette domain-containing protein [Phycicoccus sp. CSK15P-2]|uniref:ABC transporter ATP-binding protein n=1 Tax=Phycicoccus sp. CSK15P-2 TaxID=2807627 RepID=UPI001951E045|nr:ATP-binding cassette domain-containing protein [Phycicoccus sp. CSK15P-2]MBM6406046.1 ATP-binding cassette domain-containing protein [Phycicoccus sp. CSK15P-2]
MSDDVVVTRSLTKRFGHVTAVDGLDLAVHDGDRYGFLGPNGSGKTTTVRMLLGLVHATSGEVEMLGRAMPRHAHEVLPQVGALVEGPGAYGHLTGRANLRLLDAAGPAGGPPLADGAGSRRTRARRVDAVLERVGLADVGRRPVRAYSLGMRQRLGLAAALLRGPRLLVLDEPTNGLDPRGIAEVRDLLLELNAQGTTVFLSSHLLAEVQLFCTRVGVLHRGGLVAQDHLGALRGPTGRTLVRVDDVAAGARALGLPPPERRGEGELVLDGTSVAAAADTLVRAGIGVLEAAPERRTLEESVLRLTS